MSYVQGTVNLIQKELLENPSQLNGDADCKTVTIKGNYIVVKTDSELIKRKVLETLFVPGAIRKISDYVIISDDVVLICEMKSRNEGDMKTQLRNTAKLAQYLVAMIKHHEHIFQPIPQFKYVCFAKAFSNKQTTSSAKLQSFDWNNSQLYKLPCGTTYHLKQFI